MCGFHASVFFVYRIQWFIIMKKIDRESLDGYLNQEVGKSEWLTVDQAMINDFANTTKDHQFIHVDPIKAKQTPFGSTIAHGFLTLSMLSYFAENGFGLEIEGYPIGINYGFDKVRFSMPVKVGKKIRARSKLMTVNEKIQGQIIIKQRVTVDIYDEEKPALIAEWLVMYMSE